MPKKKKVPKSAIEAIHRLDLALGLPNRTDKEAEEAFLALPNFGKSSITKGER